MAVLTAITIMALSFLAYVIFRSINHIVADVFLFILFIFAFVVSNREFSLFYLLLFVIAIVIDLSIPKFEIGTGIKSGFMPIVIALIAGLGLYLVITLISVRVGGNIVGAPEIAIASTSTIAQNMRPTFVGMLGIIENRIAFAFFEVLNLFGVLIPIIGVAFNLMPYLVPIIVVGLIMGIFHVTAYSVAISLLLWASIAFMLFIASYIMMGRDSLASDTTHFLNNGNIDVMRGLSIVI